MAIALNNNQLYYEDMGMADKKVKIDAVWHTVKEFSLAEISPSIAASPLFNKF